MNFENEPINLSPMRFIQAVGAETLVFHKTGDKQWKWIIDDNLDMDYEERELRKFLYTLQEKGYTINMSKEIPT
jgi:hypothetical protein